MNDVKVTMRHVRAAGMCSYGAREFFKRHNLSWQEFLKSGISAADLIKTKDAMALQVVKVAEDGR